MTIFVFCAVEVLLGSHLGEARALIIMIIVSIPALLVFALSPDVILDFLGKDATLTGRTDLWYFVKHLYFTEAATRLGF